MSRKPKIGKGEGQSGDSVKHDPSMVGWLGHIAHPDSPAGSGGPGDFRSNQPLTVRDDPTGALNVPGPLQHIPMSDEEPEPPNAPPATNARSLGTLAEADNEHKDVSVDAKVVADGTSASGTHTFFTRVSSSLPAYGTDGEGNIESFTGKFVFKGTVAIQTVYGDDAGADFLSCYGRGTTDDDVRDRNITLGFHESRHRQDYANYLNNNSLPDLPEMRIPMPVSEYEDEKTRWTREIEAYWNDMEANSISQTDETGHHKSTWQSDGSCYVHLVP